MKAPNWKRFARKRVFAFRVGNYFSYYCARSTTTCSSDFINWNRQFYDRIESMISFGKKFAFARRWAQKNGERFVFERKE